VQTHYSSALVSAFFSLIVPAQQAFAADLALESVTLAATHAEPGEAIVASAEVVNLGGADAGISQLRYYLSTDPTLDDSDVYLNYDSVSALEVAAFSPEWANVRMPYDSVDGHYFVLFSVDHKDAVTESDETNNVVARPVTIGNPTPDLTIARVQMDQTVAPGDVLQVQVEVANAGASASGASTLKYFVSMDEVWDEYDKQLSYDKVDAIPVGQSALEQAPLRIKTTIRPGTYHLLVVADAADIVVEDNEDNNVAARTFVVDADQPDAMLPDLVAVSPSLDATHAQAGDRVTAQVTVRNDGVTEAAPTRVRYFLSTDAEYQRRDAYLNYDNVDALAPGESSPESATLVIPAGIDDGEYFVLVAIDHTLAVDEQRESDNVVALPITMGAPVRGKMDGADLELPDLMSVEVTTEHAEVAAGEKTMLTHQVFNAGNASAPASSGRYYFSVDAVYDSSDKYLGYETVDALAAGEATSEEANVRVPDFAVHGPAFFLIVVDSGGDVAESFEDNNVYAQPVYVLADDPTADVPDLLTADLATDATVYDAGDHLSVRVTVANGGTQPAPVSRTKVYLSYDVVYSATDSFLGYIHTPAVAAGASVSVEGEFRMPWAVPHGQRYLVVVADGSHAITEQREANNATVLPLTIGSHDRLTPAYPYDCDRVATTPTLHTKDTIATFNALHLGWDNQKDMVALACTISHFSLVGLVEVDTPDVLDTLERELEALTGESWSHFASEHSVGRSPGFEYYAYIWRDAEVSFTGSLGFFPDPNDTIKRQPYGANFRMGAFDFTLVVFHLRYGSVLSDRRVEAQRMDDIYDWFQAANGDEQDVLIGGDFNLPSTDPSFDINGHDGVTSITDPEQLTSISGMGLSSSFDNIFFSATHTTERRESGILDFTGGDFVMQRHAVSDHVPVWMSVDVSVDDD
jgi:subtilase family serine protease